MLKDLRPAKTIIYGLAQKITMSVNGSKRDLAHRRRSYYQKSRDMVQSCSQTNMDEIDTAYYDSEQK